MKNSKKSELMMQSIVYIMMSIFMVGIIIFGYNKIFMVNDILSEQDRGLIIQEIKQGFESCEDPLNKGNFEKIELRGNQFNSICFLGENDNSNLKSNFSELEEIFQAGDNVVLLQSTIYLDEFGSKKFSEFNIISSFNVDLEILDTNCFFDEENTGILDFDLVCD